MSWQLLSYRSPILPVHAAVLRTGKVLFFAGSSNNPSNVNSPNSSAVWDINSGNFSRPITPVNNANLPIDIFCAGQTFLADGRLLVAGGTLQYDPFYGLPAALLFDPLTEQWTQVASMNSGRWYPTLAMLGDGRILALSGLDESGLVDKFPEIYSPATNRWNFFTRPTSPLPIYAHLFLLSSGKLFFSGGQFANNKLPRIITLPTDFTQPIIETPVLGLEVADHGNQAASVLLPPAQSQKVMMIGGGKSDGSTTTNRVNIIDLTLSNPTYKPAAPLNFGRMHHNAVILPDRTVFVCNGSGRGESTSLARLAAEVYNPATNTWTVVENSTVPRLYHSVAFLLPDGRIVSAGGNPQRLNRPGGYEELRLEIYSPPYMSQPRPVINSAPTTLTYGQNFNIVTPQAPNIFKVNLIKPMATTHGLDTDQRLVSVLINKRASTYLNVTLLPNLPLETQKNIAPPGWYMLTILDNNKVPSVAKWVRLG